MEEKKLVDVKPDRSWTYQEILDWMFDVKAVWTIKGVNAHKPEDIRNRLKKIEVLEYINNNFESEDERDETLNNYMPKYECYDVKYIGNGDVIKIQPDYSTAQVFVKGLFYTFYDIGDPLIAKILNEHSDDFIVAGRELRSDERNIIDVAAIIGGQNRDKMNNRNYKPNTFFNVF